MKTLPWMLVILLIIACIASWLRSHESFPADIKTKTKIRTIVKVDTLVIPAPMSPLLIIRLTDTMHISDTIVQREQAYYEDSLYRAWVSGYRPRLDSLQIFPRTEIRTITNDIYHAIIPKKKRWGLGLQAGYGYPSGCYVGIGVSYNLFQW